MPSIAGGLDIHRKQITFDYVDLDTGAVQCGQIAPADREHFRSWLAGRFEHPENVAFAVEACAGWRYVAGNWRRPVSPRTWPRPLTPRRSAAARGGPRPTGRTRG